MFESVLGYVAGGTAVGVLARLLRPGADPVGWILTILLGIAGALLGGYLSCHFGVHHRALIWASALASAALLLMLFELLRDRRA
ncbi:MAG: GlsB/YeaQ/YmgE family stress response membrane protein [Pseudomonadota bacterium]